MSTITETIPADFDPDTSFEIALGTANGDCRDAHAKAWLGFSAQGDHGLLFSMARIMFTSGVTVMKIHRHLRPNYQSPSNW